MLAILAPLRGMGRERLAFLWLVTGGHAAIHWFQTMFAVVPASVAMREIPAPAASES